MVLAAVDAVPLPVDVVLSGVDAAPLPDTVVVPVADAPLPAHVVAGAPLHGGVVCPACDGERMLKNHKGLLAHWRTAHRDLPSAVGVPWPFVVGISGNLVPPKVKGKCRMRPMVSSCDEDSDAPMLFSDDSDSDGTGDEDLYEVKELLEKKKDVKGKMWYRVQWAPVEKYPDPTWERYPAISKCREALAVFRKKMKEIEAAEAAGGGGSGGAGGAAR